MIHRIAFLMSGSVSLVEQSSFCASESSRMKFFRLVAFVFSASDWRAFIADMATFRAPWTFSLRICSAVLFKASLMGLT